MAQVTHTHRHTTIINNVTKTNTCLFGLNLLLGGDLSSFRSRELLSSLFFFLKQTTTTTTHNIQIKKRDIAAGCVQLSFVGREHNDEKKKKRKVKALYPKTAKPKNTKVTSFVVFRKHKKTNPLVPLLSPFPRTQLSVAFFL